MLALTVDSVDFYGDLILSRACHDNVIVLWRIEGFSSDGPPLPQSAAPTAQTVVATNYEDQSRLTRSAFVPVITPECPSQYTRLLEFHTPSCGPQFFMRFSLHNVPDQNPVLAFCNAAGNIFFWDFKRLTVYQDVMKEIQDPGRDRSRPMQLPSWLKLVIPRQRADMFGRFKHNHIDREAFSSNAAAAEFSADTLESWSSKYSMDDPHEPLKAHKAESSSANFVGRQAAWSPGGEWCVVVGSSNMTLVLQRWSQKPTAPSTIGE